MELIDWRVISLIFNVFTWITGIVGFCIIKFNDFSHIEASVKKLEAKQEKYEQKQDERHLENLKELVKISNAVSYLSGKQDIKE